MTYGGLLQERRRLLHARIVDAIEALHGDRLDAQTERLAHHAVSGDLGEKAVQYLRIAGAKALGRSALRDARRWFEQALGALETLPERRATLERAFDIRLDLRAMLTPLGDMQRSLERLREAETLAERLNDDRRRGLVCGWMTHALGMLGQHEAAIESGRRGLEIAHRVGDLRTRILTTTNLEITYFFLGEYRRVAELATENLTVLPDDWVYEYFGALPSSVQDRFFLVNSLAELGEFGRAAKQSAEALRLAEPTQHSLTIGSAHLAAGRLYAIKGDLVKARALYARGIGVLRADNVLVILPHGVANYAWVLALLGETSEAGDRLAEGEQLLERRAASGLTSRRGYDPLARACLVLGRIDDATRVAARLLESLGSDVGMAAYSEHLLGEIASDPASFDAQISEAHDRKAMAFAEPLGMRPLVAHCHLGLGKVYHHTGKPVNAHDHLATATTMFREMDMQFWLAQAEALLRETGA